MQDNPVVVVVIHKVNAILISYKDSTIIVYHYFCDLSIPLALAKLGLNYLIMFVPFLQHQQIRDLYTLSDKELILF